jgi:hypothetical protein
MVVFGFETWSPSRRLVVRALIANRSIFLSFLSSFPPFLVMISPSSSIRTIYTQAPQIDPFLPFLADNNPNSTQSPPKPMHSNRDRSRACQSYRSCRFVVFMVLDPVLIAGGLVCISHGSWMGREKRARFGRLHFSRPRSNRGLRITKMRLVIDARSHDISKRGTL